LHGAILRFFRFALYCKTADPAPTAKKALVLTKMALYRAVKQFYQEFSILTMHSAAHRLKPHPTTIGLRSFTSRRHLYIFILEIQTL
jgi:hypothetical protein